MAILNKCMLIIIWVLSFTCIWIMMISPITFKGKFNIDEETEEIQQIITEPKTLKQHIFTLNTLQKVYNKQSFRNNIQMVIVVQVHNRSQYLEYLIYSLSKTPEINNTFLVFSHDVYDSTLNQIVHGINFTKVIQIFYPFSIQTHPDDFPGPDKSGSRKANRTQLKHHWWWKINFVFNRIQVLQKYHGLFLFLEEDHYVSPDFFHCLRLMETYALRRCPQCWFFTLGFHDEYDFRQFSDYVTIENNIVNLGLAFNRSVWYEISKHSGDFCKYDDYNWDWSLRHVVRHALEAKPISMTLTASRAFHVGLCGVHAMSNSCDPSTVIAQYEQQQTRLFPKEISAMLWINVSDILIKWGGWEDQRDQALCMAM